MAWKSYLLMLCLQAVSVEPFRNESETDINAMWLDMWQNKMEKADADLISHVNREDKEMAAIQPFHKWDCPELARENTATSVNDLRPHDIGVVAAIGDSALSGYGIGATTIFQCLRQNRGESWAAGAEGTLEQGILTMPNLLKKYNPDLKGGSLGASTPSTDPLSMLNRAFPGASSIDLQGQAMQLIERMRAMDDIDFEKDWKIVTVRVGAVDLCHYADHGTTGPDNPYSVENYISNLNHSLHILMNEVPRVFVNLLPVSDVSLIPLVRFGPACDVIHSIVCKSPLNKTNRAALRQLQLAYYHGLEDLVESGILEREDFTVVLQPHMVDFTLETKADGEWDLSIFSPDCVHLNRKGQQRMAIMLWNMMFTPVGQKPLSYNWTDYSKYICPTEDQPYLFTAANSPQQCEKTSSCFQKSSPSP